MTNRRDITSDADQPAFYQIRVKGHLAPFWAQRFQGLTVTLEEGGHTLLTGPLADQSALFGLLRKVRDSGMSLVSVLPLEPEQENFLPEETS